MNERKDTLIIGRPDLAAKNGFQPDIQITGQGNETVSRRHASLSRTEKSGEYILTDIGSSNGTKYQDTSENWVPAQESRVTKQTKVRFGKAEVTIEEIVKQYNRKNPPFFHPETRKIVDPRF